MPSFSKIAPTVAASLLSVAASAQNLSSCRVLIENSNDFWLAQPNGSVIARITSDGQLKPAAALQPGGSLVAYSTQDPTRDVVLSDATGHVLDQASTNAGESVVQLMWTAPGSLRAAVHQSPNHSQFHFFGLQSGNHLIRSSADSASGSDCAMSPTGKQLACTVADAVTLDGMEIYFATGPFESSTIAQTSMLALGTGLSTNTSPVLRVDFKEQTANSVTLRVTTPDNQSQEQRIPLGGAMTVVAGDGAGIFGLEPMRTTDPNTIKLAVRKSNTGRANFEANLAWDPAGKRIAVVESNDVGQRSLVLLARESGQAAIRGQGTVDANIKLPIQGPVRAVRFLTSTTIRVDGAIEAAEFAIPAAGKVRSPSYSIKPLQPPPTSLLVTLGGSPVVAAVRDWTCP